jgi:two-component system chemotaxis response regulator CheY
MVSAWRFQPFEELLAMSLRVLVADDSTSMRKLIVRSLQAAGAEAVTEACDGDEAVAQYAAGEFDLVLTDWNMPGKSGLEVVREIRAQDAGAKILMITTEAENSRVAQAMEAGVSDYLVKPFTAAALRDMLAKHGL